VVVKMKSPKQHQRDAIPTLVLTPDDEDTLDTAIRILRKPETPLRSRFIEARRLWELGVQQCEQGAYGEACVLLGDAIATEVRMLPIDIFQITTVLTHSKEPGLDTLLLTAFAYMQSGKVQEAEAILSHSIQVLVSRNDYPSGRDRLYLARYYELRTACRCLLGNKNGGLEDLDAQATVIPERIDYLYAKAKLIQGKIDQNTLAQPQFVHIEKLLQEFTAKADREEKRLPFALYHLAYLYALKGSVIQAKELFKKGMEAEKVATVLWGNDLDIENDIPRRMAFALLKEADTTHSVNLFGSTPASYPAMHFVK